jgi:hypothetical protein
MNKHNICACLNERKRERIQMPLDKTRINTSVTMAKSIIGIRTVRCQCSSAFGIG